MGFSRRQAFAAGCAALLAGAAAPRSMFLSAASTAAGQCFAVAFDGAGAEAFRLPLPGRGHQAAISPQRRVAFMAPRRPGRRATLIDLATGRQLAVCDAAPGRHFYGHAVYAPDGEHLFATENDYEGARGVITARRSDTLEVVAEFDSGGVGPHELTWFPGGRRLAVANGGIRTHPDQPRRKLNLPEMQPNLTLLDAASGRIVDQALPQQRQAGIRHLAATGDGVVAAMQYEGPPADDVPIVAMYRGDGALQPLQTPLAAQRSMRRYAAGVAADATTGHALVTCPRGNRVTFWDTRAGAYVGSERLGDCAGVALDPAAREFVVTNGRGMIARFSADAFALRRDRLTRFDGLMWDNHLASAPV